MASAPKRRKSGELDVTLHSMTIPSPFSGNYGVTFTGIAPVMVAHVDPQSPAERAGVRVGDLIARVNGHDVLYASRETVHSIVKYSQGSTLTMDIGRSFPIPATDAERRQAVVILQEKIEVEDSTEHIESYKQTIDDAFKEVQDILGSLEQVVPDVDHAVQEVEVACYDSDSLSSPPPSSEESEGEPDPLLDFSVDDELSHVPGKAPVHSQIEAERAIRGMKGIIKGVEERKRLRADEEERQRGKGLVKTETSFVPSFQSGKQQRERAQPPKTVQQYIETQPPKPVESRPSKPVESRPSKPVESRPSKPVESRPSKPVDSRPSKPVESRPSKPVDSGPVAQTHQRQRVSPVRAESPPPPVPLRTRESQQEISPPPIPPYVPEERDPFPLSNKPEYQQEWRKETHTYEAVEEVARYKSRSPPLHTESPSNVPLRTESTIPSTANVPLRIVSPSTANVPLRTVSPSTATVPLRTEVPSAANVPLRTKVPSTSNVPLRTESPSNVPLRTVSPSTANVPLRTGSPLANVPLRTVSPSTANVPLHTVSPSTANVPLRTGSPSANVPLRTVSPSTANVPLHTVSPSTANVPLRTGSPSANVPLRTVSPSTANVPLRRKKVPDRLPAAESEGHVTEPHRKQKTFAPDLPSKGAKVTDLQSLEVACSGLPASVAEWKGEELGVWLKQLSPTLYEFYFSCFSRHDITGRTVMKLNDTRLKIMGIDDPKHRRLLATQITRLKIRQEALEIKALERKLERTLI